MASDSAAQWTLSFRTTFSSEGQFANPDSTAAFAILNDDVDDARAASGSMRSRRRPQRGREGD
jgi:hypothetical protein